MNVTDLPNCHVCGGGPVFQWTRLADAGEVAEQRKGIMVLQGRQLTDDEIVTRYGPFRVPVTGCPEHNLGDDPSDASSGVEQRGLLHDADCGGHGVCGC